MPRRWETQLPKLVDRLGVTYLAAAKLVLGLRCGPKAARVVTNKLRVQRASSVRTVPSTSRTGVGCRTASLIHASVIPTSGVTRRTATGSVSTTGRRAGRVCPIARRTTALTRSSAWITGALQSLAMQRAAPCAATVSGVSRAVSPMARPVACSSFVISRKRSSAVRHIAVTPKTLPPTPWAACKRSVTRKVVPPVKSTRLAVLATQRRTSSVARRCAATKPADQLAVRATTVHPRRTTPSAPAARLPRVTRGGAAHPGKSVTPRVATVPRTYTVAQTSPARRIRTASVASA